MPQEELSYQWPSNVKTFEKRILGVRIYEMMGAAMVGLMVLALTRSLNVYLSIVLAAAAFVLTLVAIIRPDRWGGLPLPLYLYARTRPAVQADLPTIVSVQMKGEVVIETWDGELVGKVE